MGKYYLAVDIGASSGRHILGHLENGKIELEEIYRFENGMDHKEDVYKRQVLFREEQQSACTADPRKRDHLAGAL